MLTRSFAQRIDENGKNITIEVDDAAKDWLGAAGVSPLYGARPLAGVIQNNLLIPLSRYIIEESVQEGETAHVRFDPQRNRIVVVPNHPNMVTGDDSMDLDDEDLADGPTVEQLD